MTGVQYLLNEFCISPQEGGMFFCQFHEGESFFPSSPYLQDPYMILSL